MADSTQTEAGPAPKETAPVQGELHGPELAAILESLAREAGALRRRYDDLVATVEELVAADESPSSEDWDLDSDDLDDVDDDEAFEGLPAAGSGADDQLADASLDDAAGSDEPLEQALDRERVRTRRRGSRRRSVFRRRAA